MNTEPAPREMQELARRMIWWKQPEEALRYPDRLLAQVMAIATWDDAYPRRTVTKCRISASTSAGLDTV
jgi:hypothetical protein